MLEKLKHNFRVTESQFAKASTFPRRQTLLQLKASDARCRSFHANPVLGKTVCLNKKL